MNIEKGVPMPEYKGSKTGMTRIIRQLQIGDSFLIEPQAYDITKAIASRHKVRIVSAKEGDNIRVWRKA